MLLMFLIHRFLGKFVLVYSNLILYKFSHQNGGLYVKRGQGLVSMNHILPKEYLETLKVGYSSLYISVNRNYSNGIFKIFPVRLVIIMEIKFCLFLKQI